MKIEPTQTFNLTIIIVEMVKSDYMYNKIATLSTFIKGYYSITCPQYSASSTLQLV